MKKILFLNLLFLLSVFSLHAQTEAEETEIPVSGDSTYVYVDEMPEPTFSFPEFLSENLNYPNESFNNGISGTVTVKFAVNTDGSIGDIKIVGKRIRYGEELEAECIRLMKSCPKWKPGKIKGKAVKVYYTQRIDFSIPADSNR